MATYRQYKCESCGYTVEANPTGHDVIMMGEVDTYMCEQCHEIVDVMATEETICPKCGSDKLVKWNPVKGHCPKCGHKMKDTGLVLMVD